MGYIDSPKYSINDASVIISNETGIKHKVSDIFSRAKAGIIDICIYKPEFSYIQTNEQGNEYIRAYCDPLKENILIPKEGRRFSDIRVLFKATGDSFYPVLKRSQITEFLDYQKQSIDYTAFNIDAISNNGEHIKAARVWRRAAPVEGEQYEQLMAWMKEKCLKTFHLEPDRAAPMGGTLVSSTNMYYSLGDGLEGLSFKVGKKDLCITSWILKHYIESLIQPKPSLLIDEKSEGQSTEKPHRKGSRGNALLFDCLNHYKNQTGDTPGTYLQLLSYCIDTPPQGYQGIAKDKTRIRWAGGGTLTIEAFKSAFRKFKDV